MSWRLLNFTILLAAISSQFEGAAATATVPYLAEVVRIVKEVRPAPDTDVLTKFAREAPRNLKNLSLESKAEALTKYIFEVWKIAPDSRYDSREKKDNVLPDSVLQVRRGHCLGLTALFLMAAEQAGLSASLVRGPDHVFPRLCEGERCINLEMLRNGRIVPDDYYVKNLAIPKGAIEKGIYLKSLNSPAELAASLYLGLGYVAAKSRQLAVAELFYRKSIEASPGFAEPKSNLAAVMQIVGQTDEVLPLLNGALAANPHHYATLINLGALKHNNRQFKDAIDLYSRAAESNPIAIDVYTRRSRAYEALGDFKLAEVDLERVLVIEPKLCDIQKRRNEVLKKQGKRPSHRQVQELRQLEHRKECLTAKEL